MKLLKNLVIWLALFAVAASMTACGTLGGETTAPISTATKTESAAGTTTAAPTTPGATTSGPASTSTAPDTTQSGATTTTVYETSCETPATTAPTTGENGETAPITAAPTTAAPTTAAPTTAAPTTAAPTTAAPTTAAPSTAAPTTEAGGESRLTYSSSFEPVYTIADLTEIGPPISRQFLLPEVYTGHVTINFDMTSPGRSHDWMVGFVSEPMIPEFRYYTHMSIQVAMNSFNIQAINGGDFTRFGTLKLGVTYHVRIEADMDAHTYTAYITEPGVAEAMIGDGSFAFRTRGQNPVDTRVSEASTIAMIVVAGAKDNQGYMENFTITDDTP